MSRTILLVDDDKVNISLLKFALSEKKYNVVVAYNGIDGLGLVADENPDLIILDIHMPEMDGYAFMEKLKEIPMGQNIPVIMLSGQEKYEDMFVLDGVKAYFRKPVDFCALDKKIEECLSPDSGE